MNLPAAETPLGWLLVANKGEHTLSIVDPVAGNTLAVVPEDGVTGHEVVASPDGKRAFVPIYGNAGVGRAGTDGSLIRVIDLETHAVTGTVDLGKVCVRIALSWGRRTVCYTSRRKLKIASP